MDDFSKAIEIFPNYSDTWKRRGQAKSALGDYEGALNDLNKSIEYCSEKSANSDSYVEKGMIYHKIKNYRLNYIFNSFN